MHEKFILKVYFQIKMDLTQFFEEPGKALENIFIEIEEEKKTTESDGGKHSRQFAYKKKGGNFTKNDSRVLRSMQASKKRKDRRQEKHFAARSDRLKEVSEEGENKENEDDDVESKKAKTKQETRRQKLNDYLEQKKKLEDMKRKLAKPAFKVGIVHHSLAPKFTDDSDSYNAQWVKSGGEGDISLF